MFRLSTKTLRLGQMPDIVDKENRGRKTYKRMRRSGRFLWGRVAGISAAPFYLILIIVLGALEPGFEHRTSLMSVLGGAPGWRGFAFNLGVGATGVMIIIFAIGLAHRLPPKWTTKAGAALLIMGGFGLIGASVFPCNPGCTNILTEPDLVGRIHIGASLMAGMGTGLAPFFFWAAMRHDPAWRLFATSTLGAAIFANLPGVTMWITLATDYRLHSIEGLLQRAGFIVVLIWMAFISWKTGRKEQSAT